MFYFKRDSDVNEIVLKVFWNPKKSLIWIVRQNTNYFCCKHHITKAVKWTVQKQFQGWKWLKRGKLKIQGDQEIWSGIQILWRYNTHAFPPLPQSKNRTTLGGWSWFVNTVDPWLIFHFSFQEILMVCCLLLGFTNKSADYLQILKSF